MIAVEQTQFLSSKDSIKDAVIIKTLGHPIRLKILLMLDRSNCNVKHIWECLGMEQATVSQHLAVLKNRGIISSSRMGVEMRYTIANSLAQKIVTALTKN